MRDSSFQLPTGPITDSFLVRGSLVLSGQIADDYFDTLQEMEDICEPTGTWSKSALDDLLSKNLTSVIESQEPLDLAVRKASTAFWEELQSEPRTFAVELSVFGLDVACDSLTFGALSFYARPYTPERDIPRFLAKGEQVQVLHAQIQVRAVNADAAGLIGSNLLDKHLAVLNAALSDSAPSHVRLSRTFTYTHSYTICKIMTSDGQELLSNLQGRVAARVINRKEFIDLLAKRGGDRLGALLTSSSSIAERIVGAFETAGAACIEDQPHIAFLLFAMAMESAVLGKDSREELTFQFASRTAHLVSTTMEGRRKVFGIVKRLYGLRSKVVHQGSSNIAESDLKEMRYLCLTTLYALAARKDFGAFETSRELENWFESQALDSGNITDRETANIPS